MSPHYRRIAPPVLVLALLVSGCESPSAPEIHEESATPEAGLWDWFFGDDGDNYERGKVTGRNGQTYELIETEVPRELRHRTSVRLIGSPGGELEVLGHRLRVPAGAVLENTIFAITALDEGYVEVRLEANIIRRLLWFLGQVIEYVISVGEDGFNEPVILELSYASAERVEDPASLRIARYVGDDTVVLLERFELDRDDQVVRAWLNHFSRYCLVSN